MAPPSTLILGSAKSGTTALFYAIRAAMRRATGQDIQGLFEPRDMQAFQRYFDRSGDPVLLCKGLLGPVMRGMQDALPRFDRRIVIYRDPRDNIVSRLLFMPPRLLSNVDRSKCDDYLELIRQKQADPRSISVLAILQAVSQMAGRDDVPDNFRSNAVLPANIQREHGDQFWMFPYDDLVEGRFDRLSAYLGLEVTPEFEVDGQHGYVSRSKGSGEWRSWFLPEDIAFFALDVADDYTLMGFDPSETADDDPQISPGNSIDYARKQVDRLQAKRQAVRVRRREKTRTEAELKVASGPNGGRQPRKPRKQNEAVAAPSTDKAATATDRAVEARRARRQKRQAPNA
ncbi:MAG: hypothetical protein ACRC14_17440 [Paracoccaceae bacterium]